MSRRFMRRAVAVITALLVLTLPTVTLAAPADDAIRRLRQHVPPALAGTCDGALQAARGGRSARR
jgi:hypothetical protein